MRSLEQLERTPLSRRRAPTSLPGRTSEHSAAAVALYIIFSFNSAEAVAYAHMPADYPCASGERFSVGSTVFLKAPDSATLPYVARCAPTQHAAVSPHAPALAAWRR